MSVLTNREVQVGGPATLARVNLLPPEIGLARRFRRVQAGLGAGVVTCAVLVAGLYVSASGSVSSAQDEVTAAQGRQQVLQHETARYAPVTATYARAAEARAMLVAAMGDEVRYSRFVNDLTVAIPDGVWVKTVTWSQDTTAATGTAAATAGTTAAAAPAVGAPVGLGHVTLQGVARNHDQVAAWLDRLAQEKGYGVPTLQSSVAGLIGSSPIVTWSATATLSADALSGRYAKTGN